MGRTKNLLAHTEGHLGDITTYERNGKVIARVSSNRRTTKGRTAKSMARRTLTSNYTTAWNAFSGNLRDFFDPQPGQAPVHRFLSLNAQQARVHLTAQEAATHACVADHFTVASGPLPTILMEERDGVILSDIELPSGTTSVGEAAQHLCRLTLRDDPDEHYPWELRAEDRELRSEKAHSGDFFTGDVIQFVRLIQTEQEGIPRVVPKFYGICLDLFSPDPLPEDGFLITDNRLSCRAIEGTLVAWIHLRMHQGLPIASTQRLVGHNPLLSRYTSEEALARAIASYGPLDSEATPSPTPSPDNVQKADVHEDVQKADIHKDVQKADVHKDVQKADIHKDVQKEVPQETPHPHPDRQALILQLLRANPKITLSTLATALNVSTKTIQRDLTALHITRQSGRKSGQWNLPEKQ